METFAPNDRVIAINTDVSHPICPAPQTSNLAYSFPDGTLHKNTIYHVAAVRPSRDGNQGLFITGLRIHLGNEEIPWNSSRFRKITPSTNHSKSTRKSKLQPTLAEIESISRV